VICRTNHRVDVAEWYHPVITPILERKAGQSIRLVLDVTKVGFGHRMAMISLAYRRRTIPVMWVVEKGRKGHVAADVHIELLRTIRPWLPATSSIEVLADAGYASVDLLRWLGRQKWDFIIRAGGHVQVSMDGDRWRKLGTFALAPGQTHQIGWVRVTQQHNYGWLYLVLHWEKGEDDPWYLLTNRNAPAHVIIRRYMRRMWIEEMFGDMKGHGFDLETTHLRDADRITRLILGVCIAYVWLISLGSWVVKNGVRHFIDVKSRRDKSYFRLGLDWLARCRRLNQLLPLRFVPYYL
jgi:hypothetical protein